jgi:hypothetical protein
LGMTRFSEGRDSDVPTFWAAALSHRASYVLSRRTMSGTSSSVESPHCYHHHRQHQQQQQQQVAEKEEVYYSLFTNKAWSGDAQRSTVLLYASLLPAHHHNPPTHQNPHITHSSSVRTLSPSSYFPGSFLDAITDAILFTTFIFLFSIRNTIRLSMLPCRSFRPCFRLAILKHYLRIVLRTLFLDLGRFSRSIILFITLGYGILSRTTLRINIINTHWR